MQRQVRNSKFFCSQALYVMLSGWSVQCCNVYFIFLNGLLYFLQQLIFNEHKKLMCIFYNNLSVLYPCWKYYPKFFFYSDKVLSIYFAIKFFIHNISWCNEFLQTFRQFPNRQDGTLPQKCAKPLKASILDFFEILKAYHM